MKGQIKANYYLAEIGDSNMCNRMRVLGILFSLVLSAALRAAIPEYCLAVSPDGKTVAANLGGMYGVEVFDLSTGKGLAELESATPEVVK